MRKRTLRFALHALLLSVCLSSLPGNAGAQYRLRDRFTNVQASGLSRSETGTPSRRSLFTNPVRDSTVKSDKSLYVVSGAVVGAIVAMFVYKRHVDEINDGDFAAPLSTIIYGGVGAAIGALLGLMVSPD